ncbi:hypothetical protein SODALDRAFT_320033 [Sodiomyces alkalinus F11]|uniref:HMG box domain-containing protein n=1 Tax=Sodiomyces alkalinus (strain CBS 110278 / VKM F-3762 / F11) TaxID=1314773 RepID=A0A3N2QA25_SODAK|nr:hypothetical protein SODALDRAFT_320033 [Sodiomyces alkalinus F11]ROT43613.1 hypothetical protein SODALDRAFT_320033 [Sodiomyces alkalinus F11]
MPRVSKKAAEEAKAKAAAAAAAAAAATAPAVAPAPAPVIAQAPSAPIQQVPSHPQQMGIPQGTLGLHPTPVRHIDPEGFIRVRDSVHHRLLTILELIKSFSVDYYRQTNLLLGEASTEIPGIDVPLGNLEHAVQNIAAIPGLMQSAAEYGPPAEEKKERKKRTHDPNAPKRPLTPYFLYMQTARPIIGNDLGPDAPKGAVQEEGQRRWKAMGQAEKNGWNNAYQYNLRLYQARVHSYKHGNPDAKLMTDEEALQYADANEIPLPHLEDDTVPDEEDAIAEQLRQATPGTEAEEVEEEEVEEPPAPTKTPKKASRKRKSEAAESEPAKSTPAAAVASAVATPDTKKRRRTSKAIEAESTREEPVKKSRAKKAKN